MLHICSLTFILLKHEVSVENCLSFFLMVVPTWNLVLQGMYLDCNSVVPSGYSRSMFNH